MFLRNAAFNVCFFFYLIIKLNKTMFMFLANFKIWIKNSFLMVILSSSNFKFIILVNSLYFMKGIKLKLFITYYA